jgi:hypothetical protein
MGGLENGMATLQSAIQTIIGGGYVSLVARISLSHLFLPLVLHSRSIQYM